MAFEIRRPRTEELKRGWQRLREIPHEIVSAPRLEMTKAIG
jgi:hypothetical protein